MDILTLLVVATIIIAAAFVGYHASQEPPKTVEDHGKQIELKTLDDVNDKNFLMLLDQTNIKTMH